MKKYIAFVGQVLMGSATLLLVMKVLTFSLALLTFFLGVVIYLYGTVTYKKEKKNHE